MKKKLLITTIIILGLLLPGVCAAKRFSQNGYKISMKWRQSNNKFMVKGTVKNGKVCRQLNLLVEFINLGDRTSTISIKEPISYQSTNGVKFYTQDRIDSNTEFKNKWVVDSLKIKCLR